MWQPAELFSKITPSEWTDELANIENWSFEHVPKRSPNPTCVFTILIRCRLSGFERVQGELNVDEKDMAQVAFRNLSDPMQAYTNYARSQFETNQLDFAKRAMINYRNRQVDQARIAITSHQKRSDRISAITDPKLKAATINIENMRHDMLKKGFIGKNAPYAHLDYRKSL